MDIQSVLNDIYDEMQAMPEKGKVADYIPELATVDPDQFAISVCTADGETYTAGQADTRFSIQSVSKVFTLALALGRLGDSLWNRVGREPSGDAFNSIVLLEQEKGHPRNPFINAGAIVVTDAILAGHSPKETLGELLRFIQFVADDPDIHIREAVAMSEKEHGFRNAALANYLHSYDNLFNPVDLTLGVYFHQCALEMTATQLAKAGRFLARLPGYDNILSPQRVRRINALMLTCGQYDGSGDFAYSVGIPGKSGVGGGILAVVPKKASIAVWSPGLNANGNSHRGTIALERLATRMGWSVF